MMQRRTALTLSVLSIALSATAVTGSLRPLRASAAGVSLTEVSASPIVSNLGPDPVINPGQSLFSSAAVGDVTGDGTPEIVVGSIGGIARVIRLNGSLIAELDPGVVDPATARGAIQSSPTLGDLNGDGVDDVIITNLAGRIAAYSLAGGAATPLYNHYAPPAFENAGLGLFGTPALGYLDRDTQLDAVTSSWGQTVDVWSGPTGQPLPYLRQWVKDTIWSSPAVGDIDGDGAVEIVVGGDCEGLGTGAQPCDGIGQGGYVWAFNLDGTVQWSYFVRDAVVWSSPALTDLNHDGALDVVVGTGIYFDRPGADRIRALDGRTGQLLWEGATPGRVMGSPSVATVGGEQRVWVMSEGGWLLSWNEAGDELWRQCVSDQPCNDSLGTFGGVAIADVNNDGRLDAVVQAEAHLRVVNAETGQIQASTASRYSGVRFASYATPTVTSVGGATWIVMVGIGDGNDDGNIGQNDHLLVTAWTTGTALGAAPWPTFKQNMARTSGPLPVVPDPSTFPDGPIPGRVCMPVAGSPGDAAIVNLTPVLASGPGNGQLVSSDIAVPPVASNVNYAPGTVDPNVALAPIGADGAVCYVNSEHSSVHLVADHLGTVRTSAYTPATPTGAPERKLDTRVGIGAPPLPVPALGRICFPVAGSPGEAAIVNLTPVEAQAPGHGQLVSSDIVTPPVASNVNYTVGSVDPNVAIAPIGSDGRVCYVNSEHAAIHLVADHLGTIRAGSYTPATPTGAPDRKVDTRVGLGAGAAPIEPLGRVCFSVAGAPGEAAIVNLTPVDASGPGNGQLLSSDITSAPVASNVNFRFGSFDPNVAIAPIGNDGQVCFVNSEHAAVHLVADHLGTIRGSAYTPASPGGAPVRTVDTRSTGVPISPS